MAVDPEQVIASVLAGASRGQEAPALCLRGEDLRVAGDLDASLACFDRALRYDVTNALAWVGRSRILNARNRDKEAFNCINRALDVDPRFAPALVVKADILSARGSHEEALAAYEAALGSGAQHDAVAGRAAAMRALGRSDAPRAPPSPPRPPVVAAPPPRPAPPIETPPERAAIVPPLVEKAPDSNKRLDARAEKKTVREDGRAPKKSVRTDSRPDRKSFTSDPLVAKKSDPAMALGAAVSASSIPPKRPSMRLSGVPGVPVRRLTQAEEDIATLEDVHTLALGGRHVESLRKLEPLAQRLPGAREPWILRGHILFALKQFDAALATAERVLKLGPKDQEALLLMVKALSATGKDVRALETVERLVALAPDDVEVQRLRADCLVAAMRHADAIVAYEGVLKLVPDHAAAWFGLGRTLRLVRRARDARHALNKAIALAEEQGSADLVAQANEVLAKLPV